jgi:hypothetical protein
MAIIGFFEGELEELYVKVNVGLGEISGDDGLKLGRVDDGLEVGIWVVGRGVGSAVDL